MNEKPAKLLLRGRFEACRRGFSRARAHRVLGGADGPVRLDAHVTLDGDSLQIAIARGGWGVGQSPRRDARGGATRDFSVAGEITRHCRDAVLRRARGASRTFLAAKDFFAPANWGRTAVAEAIPARFSRDGEVGSVEQFVKTPSLEAPPRFRESSSPIRRRGFR